MTEPITREIIDELLREEARMQRKLNTARAITYTFVAVVLLIAILA